MGHGVGSEIKEYPSTGKMAMAIGPRMSHDVLGPCDVPGHG